MFRRLAAGIGAVFGVVGMFGSPAAYADDGVSVHSDGKGGVTAEAELTSCVGIPEWGLYRCDTVQRSETVRLP